MIDHYGLARLCFSTAFPGKMLRNPGDLKDFWEGASRIRARMSRCNQFCGISHSVRRQSSTLAGNEKALAHIARFGPLHPPGRMAEIMAGIRSLAR